MKAQSLFRQSTQAANAIPLYRASSRRALSLNCRWRQRLTPRTSASTASLNHGLVGLTARRYASTETTKGQVEGRIEQTSATDTAGNATDGVASDSNKDTTHEASGSQPHTDTDGVLRHFEGEEIPSPDDVLLLEEVAEFDTAEATTLDQSLDTPTSRTIDTAIDATNEDASHGSKDSNAVGGSLPADTVLTVEDVEKQFQNYLQRLPARDDVVRYRLSADLGQGLCIENAVRLGKDFSVRFTWDRKEKGNSLSTRLMSNLTVVFQALAKFDTLACVVLSSRNNQPPKQPVFCGGADVKTMASLNTPDEAEAFIRTISKLCTAIRDLPAPVIAEIDGPCIGAGLEMAAACDIRIASAPSSFSMPEVKLGIPSVVEARLLCDIVGWGRARHLMLTGEAWTAEEALQAGLITKLVPSKKALGALREQYMADMSINASTYRAQKSLMRFWENRSIEDGIEAGVRAFADVWRNQDTKKLTKDLMNKPRVKAAFPEDQTKQPNKVQKIGDVVNGASSDIDTTPDESEHEKFTVRRGGKPTFKFGKNQETQDS